MLRKCVEENDNNALAERYESIKKGFEVINEKRFERRSKQESI